MNLLFNANSVPAALMQAALTEQDLLCRVFGRCRHGAPIDLEVGDLRRGEGLLEKRLFSYVRYNAELSRGGLDALGHHRQVETVGHTDHGADQRDVAFVVGQVGDEGAVQLDLADR
jgi:hypothetical protein